MSEGGQSLLERHYKRLLGDKNTVDTDGKLFIAIFVPVGPNVILFCSFAKRNAKTTPIKVKSELGK